MIINQNVKDVRDALDTADRSINEIKEGYVCELGDNIESALNAVSEAEDQLRYLDEDLNELEEYREIGDVYELQELESERDDLREDLEKATAKGPEFTALEKQHENLKKQHEVQRQIIHALLERIREVSALTTQESILDVMQVSVKAQEQENKS